MRCFSFLFLIAAFWPAFPVEAQALSPPNPDFTPEYIAANRGTEQFLIPEAFELANIIISLTPYGRENPNRIYQESDYYRAVQEHFGRFADHPIIAALHLRSDEDFDRFIRFRENGAYWRFDGDELVRDGPYRDHWGEAESNYFAEHAALVEDFARKSEFRTFFARHRPYYDRLIAGFSATAPLSDMIDWLEANFGPGYRYDAYKVIFSPLIAFSHSAYRGEAEGFRESLMFVGAPHIFGDTQLAEAEVARMIFTEIDHNFVNPVSDRFAPQIEKAMAKVCFWNDAATSGGYDSAYATFNEYMTWSLFTLWAEKRYGSNIRNFWHIRKLNRQDMYERGFRDFTFFDRALARVAQEQGESARIPDLYPALIEAVREREHAEGAKYICGEQTNSNAAD